MTFCTGCNKTLGWKKYNFQKQWRVAGYFCKHCMKKIGQDFDDHGKITIPKKICESCNQEFYFLYPIWSDSKQHHRCHVCITVGVVKENDVPPIPPRIPIMMAIFAVFGILLMIMGFAYVLLVAPQTESGILHVIIGSSMSGAGFMLARKMIKVRNHMLQRPKVTVT